MPTEIEIEDKATSIYSSKSKSSRDGIPEQTQELIKSEAEKRLYRKINYTLLPFVGICVFLQFTDKATLGISAVLGIIQDTHLTGTQYSWLGSLFYLGYISYQLPNSYLIQKFPISKYLGTLIILWGITMGCTALCNNFAELAGCRVLLGLFEAATYPCLTIIINSVYRRSEQSAGYGFLWLSNGFGMIGGALVAFGIAHINNYNGIHTWRWPYIIWGSITVFVGILVFFFLPDTPYSFMFRLTEEEKEIVKERVRDNAVVRVREFKIHQVWEAIKEPRLWLLCLCTFCNNVPTGGLVVFNTIIVRNLGFSPQVSILLQIPVGVSAIVIAIVAIYVERKSGSLYLSAFVCATICLVGLILLAVLPNTGVKYIGYVISYTVGGVPIILLTLVAANVSGYTKKLFYNGMNLIFYTLGNFAGPLLMLEREAPLYKTGMIIFCIFIAAIIVMLFFVRQLMARENKIRLANPPEKAFDADADLTDKENTSFIYKL